MSHVYPLLILASFTWKKMSLTVKKKMEGWNLAIFRIVKGWFMLTVVVEECLNLEYI